MLSKNKIWGVYRPCAWWGIMRGFCAALALAVVCSGSSALAQNYDQTIFFGDSSSDSGRYLYLKDGALGFAPPGTGAFTTNPGPEWSVALGAKFGITVTPSDAPGGGNNYAAGGALVATTTANVNAWPATAQVASYLTSVNSVADPNALYSVWIGVNDLKPSSSPDILGNTAAITALAGQTANLVFELHDAGARYILVPNIQTYSSPNSGLNPSNTEIDSRNLYSQTVWNDIAAAGINFIPADYNGLLNYVLNNPSQFGIAVTSIASPACGLTTNAFQCGPSNLVAPNANLTYFFADGLSAPDGGGHVTTAVQQILADYAYSLITAPSLISFLPENAVKTRLGLVSSIQNQIELSESHRGPTGINAWVTGGVTAISLDNYRYFPGDPNTVISGAAGVDYAFAPGLIAGVAVSEGSLTSALGTYGNFKQDESTVSLYASYKAGPIWANVIGTYGHLDYDVNRIVPIGISLQSNTGSTSGDNWSAAFQGGYKFWNEGLTHGPIAGFIYQDVNVDAFTETGSFTSLGFGSQTRESAVGQFGYKASYDWSDIQPFAQLTWNHEFADTNRNVTASLTTVAAPSFSLPAVILGKDWGEVKGGVTVDAGHGVKFFAVGSADFGQNSATVYGGQFGFNIAF